MKNRLFLFLIMFILSGLISCKTTKPVASKQPRSSNTSISQAQSVSDYVNLYKDLAISEMKRTGIPASITLAQGIIESDCGRSELATLGNNHFGIKCHNDWTGSTIKHNDNSRNECFRKYPRAEESFYDHSDFLKSGSRYSFLFNISATDYKAWAYGLKKAGYATNPDYANMLIRTIEGNNLSSFDQVTNFSGPPVVDTVIQTAVVPAAAANSGETIKKSQQPPVNTGSVVAKVPRVMVNNNIRYIIVRDGDTMEKIENEYQLLKWELARYNEIKSDFSLVPGQILYLEPKKDKAEEGKEFYNATNGDTMYEISQQFGVKLKKLYQMNRMALGTEPEAGRKIWLRNIKPAEQQQQ
jgi:LysM repeat protein